MDIDAIAIRDLDRETVRRLSQRSDARGLLQLGIHAGLLFATGFLLWASRGHLWLAPAIVLHGLVLNFLFCALHESIHRTAFASRWPMTWSPPFAARCCCYRANSFASS